MARWGGRRVQRLAEIVRRTYGEDCWLCGHPIPPGQFSIDHVLPRSRGGTDDLDNLRPACSPCNSSRGARPPRRINGPTPSPSRKW